MASEPTAEILSVRRKLNEAHSTYRRAMYERCAALCSEALEIIVQHDLHPPGIGDFIITLFTLRQDAQRKLGRNHYFHTGLKLLREGNWDGAKVNFEVMKNTFMDDLGSDHTERIEKARRIESEIRSKINEILSGRPATLEEIDEFEQILRKLPSEIDVDASYSMESNILLQEIARIRLNRVCQEESKVFISYKRTDWDRYVLPLIQKLEAADISYWVDQYLIEGGDDWLDEINDALRDCDKMVLCVSPESLQSRHVRMEYRYFFNNSKVILPLMCQSTALPAELQVIQYFEFTDIEKLVEVLKGNGSSGSVGHSA